jgi:predicted transposase/invertase (TIGR01784 family)
MFELSTPCGIDSRVDLIFAFLLGDPAHEDIRIEFLNAVNGGERPLITSAKTLNPIHPSSFQGQRELRVDVEVVDEQGHTYQIEMQRQSRTGLAQRMLYGWARLYAGQMREQPEYRRLRPMVGIWLCDEDPFPGSAKAHLRFRVQEKDESLAFHPDFAIDVIRLSKVTSYGSGLPDVNLGRWCRFLNESAHWRTIPPEVYSPALEHAMKAIDTFRSDAERNAIYQARLNYQLERSAELDEVEEMRENLQAALSEKEAERTAKEAALAEVATLRARLAERES